MNGKRVILIHTGGTIGMVRTPSGYAPRAGHLAELLAAMPELGHPSLPDFALVEHDPLKDSSDMRPGDWQRLAREVVAAADGGADGVVVLHGTDTMAYSAAALSFLLEGLDRPVILTGSQIPLLEARNDARENLVTALELASRDDLAEVCVYASGALLRGNRCTKVSASGFDAFESPNHPPLGRVGVTVEVDGRLLRPPAPGPLRAATLREAKVLALRLFPGIGADTLRNVLREPVEGMVLETFGAGNAPADDALLEVLADATARGVVVVNCSQCLRGRVDMGGYAAGAALRRAGVVSGGDMTAEAALTKLVYLLSVEREPAAVARRMSEDLRGELSA